MKLEIEDIINNIFFVNFNRFILNKKTIGKLHL